MNHTPESPSAPTRRPYTQPQLREFGPVTAITATVSMDGQLKDGGPNNIKT